MEWKRYVVCADAPPKSTLETSLVEWKHGDIKIGWCGPPGFGNFLSGMETEALRGLLSVPPSLGNFLSGMETVRRVRGRPAEVHLGNFLSGMETDPAPGFLNLGGNPLETSLY